MLMADAYAGIGEWLIGVFELAVIFIGNAVHAANGLVNTRAVSTL